MTSSHDAFDSGRASSAQTDSALDRAADVMAAILDRCVWSQTMTHETLAPYLVEECYELIEAIETGTRDDLVEELGDVLWQVLFHAEIASRTSDEAFTVQDVAERLIEKMVPRHPHVFGDEHADTPEQVMVLWRAAKAQQKQARRSVLEGIPTAMPSLARAAKVLERGARLGVEPTANPPQSGAHDTSDPDGGSSAQNIGERLLTVLTDAYHAGVDADRALRDATRRYERQIVAGENG